MREREGSRGERVRSGKGDEESLFDHLRRNRLSSAQASLFFTRLLEGEEGMESRMRELRVRNWGRLLVGEERGEKRVEEERSRAAPRGGYRSLNKAQGEEEAKPTLRVARVCGVRLR